jgi:hypothetical protein
MPEGSYSHFPRVLLDGVHDAYNVPPLALAGFDACYRVAGYKWNPTEKHERTYHGEDGNVSRSTREAKVHGMSEQLFTALDMWTGGFPLSGGVVPPGATQWQAAAIRRAIKVPAQTAAQRKRKQRARVQAVE